MTDAELVVRKLAVLREHVARARRRRPATLDGLRTNIDVKDMLALSVLVALQEAIDIAFHIVADEGWGAPASYGESFEVLAARGVIDRALGEALVRGVGLRKSKFDQPPTQNVNVALSVVEPACAVGVTCQTPGMTR